MVNERSYLHWCAHFMLGALLISVMNSANGHGLVENPPARNWFCGVITKPHETQWGGAEYQACADAFAQDSNGGYQFMSVLTHARGRAQVRPLPQHVCGFGSETWSGGPTPWDSLADWPTSPMSSGRQEFTWNISWGPHFDDTEEFRYWITTPGFTYDRNRPLSWDDFENSEFCALEYDNNNPSANPDVIPLVGSAQFKTYCNVPQRRGRHVIYAEWGRNEWTLERFHSCIDVAFDGTPPPPPDAKVAAKIDWNNTSFTGEGRITLDGSASKGLEYLWSLSAADDSLYSIADPRSATTTLTLANPAAAMEVKVSLLVSNNNDSATDTVSFTHEPQVVSAWKDLGPLTTAPQDLEAGDKLSIRTVTEQGEDNYYPVLPLELDSTTGSASTWPLVLADAVNALDANIVLGVLDNNDQVNPVVSETENRIYAASDSNVVSAFLNIDRPEVPDGLPTVGFKVTELQVQESVGAVRVSVVLSKPSSGTTAIQFASAEDTAKSGSDFFGLAGRLEFAPGMTEQEFEVIILGNDAQEEAEQFVLRLFREEGLVLDNKLLSVVINDDDLTSDHPKIITTSDREVLPDYGWVLFQDGTKQWIDVDCRTQLDAAGFATDVLTWDEIVRYTDANPKACDEIAGGVVPDGKRRILVTPDREAPGNYGWHQSIESGTKQWIDADCRDQLESDGLVVTVIDWTAISTLPDVIEPVSCERLRDNGG